jgi:hypothetical protein
MSTNRIAHLFIIHVLNNLDDTVISKKKIIHDMMLTLDDNFEDKFYQNLYVGIHTPLAKRFFDDEEITALSAYKEQSTSKKDSEQRREELMSYVCKPLESFFEEKVNLMDHLLNINKLPILSKTFAMRIELGNVTQS